MERTRHSILSSVRIKKKRKRVIVSRQKNQTKPTQKSKRNPETAKLLRKYLPRDFQMRTAFQFMAKIKSIQADCRRLFVFLRDVDSKCGIESAYDAVLFPLVSALVKQTCEMTTHYNSFKLTSADNDKVMERKYYPLISRSLYGREMPAVIRGYIVCAEWGAFWRNQRRVYACLCDGGKLLFFTSQKQCEEYLFEQTRSQEHYDMDQLHTSSTTTMITQVILEEDVHRKILKKNAPQSTIDLVEKGWSVRRGENNDGARSSDSRRHAFALFDSQGKMKLIVDVKTRREAEQWITAIQMELKQAEMVKSMIHTRGLISQMYEDQRFITRTPHQLRSLLPSEWIDDQGLSIPLRWLHAQIDHESGGRAHLERIKSSTLTQALKDVRRDRLRINGIVYNGVCVEEIMGALLMEISSAASKESNIMMNEMTILQLAHQILLFSSRTPGGGDILDALHLVFRSDQFCFCPESTGMEPIDIRISLANTSSSHDTCVVADIRIRMTYRIVPAMMEAEDPIHTTLIPSQCTETVFRMEGIYHRHIQCTLKDWDRLNGSVHLKAVTLEEDNE